MHIGKLKPVRAYLKRGNEKSVKRSMGHNRDPSVSSPYVDGRENPGMININKIRRSRILINSENEMLKSTETDSKDSVQLTSNPEGQSIPERDRSPPKNPRPINYLPIKPNSGSIPNQLSQNRWKSTLHSRGLRSNFYLHKKEEEGAAPKDHRSASFQPSVIRRRDGNKVQTVDLHKEMLQNIKKRRMGKFSLFILF